MNYRGLELKLRKIVEAQLEDGRYLWSGGVTGSWRGMIGHDGLCCLVGIIAVEAGLDAEDVDTNGVTALRRRAAEFIGLDQNDLSSLESGFENGSSGFAVNPALVVLGERLRRDYFETA